MQVVLRWLVCLVSICIVIGLVGREHVHAVGIAPAVVDGIQVNPGGRVQFPFRIINDSTEEKTYYFRTQNFTADDEEHGGQRFIDNGLLPADADLASWLQVVNDVVRVPAGQEREVFAVVDVPMSANPGGHYAAIWVSDSAPDQPGTEVSISSNVGVLVLINVGGDIVEEAEIVSFDADRSVVSAGPVSFSTRVRNYGTVYFEPAGEIRITSMFGSEVARFSANPRGSNVLPDSIRRLEGAQWREPVAPDFFSALRQEWQSLLIGRYTATLEIIYPEGTPLRSTPIVLWVFPWRLVSVIVCSLLFLAIVLALYNKFIIARAMRRQS